MPDPAFLFFLFLAALIIVAIVYGSMAARKRREAMRALAAELGFEFSPGKNRQLASRFDFLNKLARGSNRYAYNVLTGRSTEGEPIYIFDYHFETYSTDSDGNRTTHHHRFSFLVLLMSRRFPELTIGKEGFLSKIAQALGYDDIDFESHEFSRSFCVRSRDKKFAYDFCNARMIDFLLGNRDLTIEVEGPALAIGFDRRLDIDEIRDNLTRLLTLRSLMPEYLFS